MEHREANLYIETSAHGPAQKGGKCAFVLEYTDKPGKTRTGMSVRMDKRETELTLLALYYGLTLTEPFTSVTIYAARSCGIVKSAINGGWLKKWKENGWKKANGEEIQYRKLRQAVEKKVETRQVSVKLEHHPYRNWMQDQMKREPAPQR